jgi:hypothetical protein
MMYALIFLAGAVLMYFLKDTIAGFFTPAA